MRIKKNVECWYNCSEKGTLEKSEVQKKLHEKAFWFRVKSTVEQRDCDQSRKQKDLF